MANTTTEIFSSRSFDDSSFRNVLHAANMALIAHYADFLFDGDTSRVIYSTSDYAFRRRIEMQSGEGSFTANNLNLPFMNFAIAPNGVTNGGDRRWWNHTLNHEGLYIPELERKMRLNPIQIQYDSTLFVKDTADAMFSFSEILWDDSNETILEPMITIDGTEVKNIGILGYNPSYNTRYNEQDWLEQNRIKALDINMSLQTWMMQDNTSGFGIPKKFVLQMYNKDNASDNLYLRTIKEAIIDHDEEEVGEFTDYSGDPDDIPELEE